MSKKIAFYHCHTPLHIGSGTTLDVIDLPIQREAHTDYPVMPSTAIKGVIRAEYGLKESNFTPEEFPEKLEDCKKEKTICKEFFEIFGDGDQEGDIIFTDGKILLFPVKSVKGVFAWITCPLVLKRFSRDIGLDNFGEIDIKKDEAIAIGDKITIGNGNKKYVVLEELSFKVKNNNENSDVIENIHKNLPQDLQKDIEKEKIIILSDDNFKYFVKNHTEVNARTRIDQTTGTVKTGSLWYEELVPAETVFYNAIFSRTEKEKNLNKVKNFIDKKVFQFGGDETLGRGFTKVYIKEG
ncbi:type III-B CRISPR module RAMP protein Cmr4 [Hydrogenothermus marinus]|uniref:CRISPR-associated protein Cmr4 n=1 Tax=Hydrogenothermus marinus TaxID=133270 RepID=A0A3M0BII7_9AQUI|nr:type III-B CRISPR module RAMP protein Cmr4 [Hydrogenothermus marinus]RMA96967.1 CRISPR-associated protein Cmr4 [Hydrogenothermus marinus]